MELQECRDRVEPEPVVFVLGFEENMGLMTEFVKTYFKQQARCAREIPKNSIAWRVTPERPPANFDEVVALLEYISLSKDCLVFWVARALLDYTCRGSSLLVETIKNEGFPMSAEACAYTEELQAAQGEGRRPVPSCVFSITKEEKRLLFDINPGWPGTTNALKESFTGLKAKKTSRGVAAET